MANLFSKKENQQINLIPEREFVGTIVGRILSWIISTFRIIVIATELLVMVAFLSRFWLDAQNTDLTEELEQKKSIVSASLDFERQFKDAQQRLRIYSTITNIRPPSNYISAISKGIPADILLSDVSLSETDVEIRGIATNEQSAQQFLTNLQALDLFTEVSLTDIKSNQITPDLISFIIKTSVKEGGPAQ